MIIGLGSKNYEKFSYPAGELQVRITKPQVREQIGESQNNIIFGRIRSADDIMETALLADAIAAISPSVKRVLVLPYLPYGRADRRFVDGDCFGLSVFARLLFNISVDEVRTLDVHSSIANNWIKGFHNISADPFVLQAINMFAKSTGSHCINVLLPDEGSKTRYHIPASTGCNTYGIDVEVFNASKKRDPATGLLSGFDVPDMPCHPTLIVDDLADGGSTFIGIAQQLTNIGDLGLYTTHGIYSRGLGPLKMWFKYLYTTNSFKEDYTSDPVLTVMDCIPGLLSTRKAVTA